jgi:histidinol-phosphate aminotransferase
MVDQFFTELLQRADSRIASVKQSSRYLLDKNEQSDDVDMALKEQVIDALLEANWNRYPAADYRDIEVKVADYCGMEPENIVLSNGSASIITTLLNFFALNGKRIVITQPSYSLFDYHCKTYNIPYQAWYLTPELEYDYDNMPDLGANSVMIITSPNNPVGNTMELEKLEQLLSQYPDSFIILDAVYCEFCEVDVTPLVKKYPNLIVLRSFSKAFPIAGLRLGYLCASPNTAAIIKKLVLQFSINHFTLIFAHEMLFNETFMDNARKRVREILGERERMYRAISHHFDSNTLRVFKSEGNFLLIRITEKESFDALMEDLSVAGIKVLNTSNFPLLENTFRVSIGTPHENEVFYNCLKNSLLLMHARAAVM